MKSLILRKSLEIYRQGKYEFLNDQKGINYSDHRPPLPSFEGLLPLKRTLVANFSETRALTYRKYVAEQRIKLKR